MKTVFITDDGKSFDNKADAVAHERELERYIPVPLPLLREALRQATPYHVTARERRNLEIMLRPLVDGSDDYFKRMEENQENFDGVMAALNDLAPMADSNDMTWTQEAMMRISAIKDKLSGRPPEPIDL